MVFGPKTIGKPLLPMVLGTKNHRKTIDINGDFPSIHSMAMVSIKTSYKQYFTFNLMLRVFFLKFLCNIGLG